MFLLQSQPIQVLSWHIAYLIITNEGSKAFQTQEKDLGHQSSG